MQTSLWLKDLKQVATVPNEALLPWFRKWQTTAQRMRLKHFCSLQVVSLMGAGSPRR